MTFADLAPGPADGGARLRVCIVSSEFLGPVRNGGIATATSALASLLAGDGHEVTLLYTYVGEGKPVCGDRPWSHWVETLAQEGIELAHIAHEGPHRAWRQAAWTVMEFLGARDFDVVYFNEHLGGGYYAQLARREGLPEFRRQTHCVITHGSIDWIFDINDRYVEFISDVEWIGLERRSFELADVVISPSAYLLREYERRGWRLPARTYRQPYPVIRKAVVDWNERPAPVRELVFFGRLEVRKGLWLFCEALDRLAAQFPSLEVTFLGRATEFSGISSALQIVNRSARWPFRVRLLADYDQEEALAYLREPGRLAVMPSIADNSPCVVYECMEAGIPFVATSGSGAEELIDPRSHADVLTAPDVKALAGKLEEVLRTGGRRARPRFAPQEILDGWTKWHRHLAAAASQPEAAAATPGPRGGDAQEAPAALIVIIDNGECLLSLLIDNLVVHIRRFGARAAYLLMSTRRGELQEILASLFPEFEEPASPPVIVFDPRNVDDAREAIAASAHVFFADAECEILPAFFTAASRKLQRHDRLIVTCATAVRADRQGKATIETLPCGDLPGIAALGEPIGGAVWAVTGAGLADVLAALAYYDARNDRFAASAELGQMAMQAGIANNIELALLPLVGAIETRGDGRPAAFTLDKARRAATALGVKPSVHAGGASWIAVSSIGAQEDVAVPAPLLTGAHLPAGHPYRTLKDSSHGDTAVRMQELAASLGRIDLALQLQASRSPAAGFTRHLTDMATRALRGRPTLELATLFSEAAYAFGTTPTPLRGKAAGAESTAGAGRLYVDARRLRVAGGAVQCVDSLRSGGPAKLYIVDLPLCGQNRLVARLRARAGSDTAFVRIIAVDQGNGEIMGEGKARLAPGQSPLLTVALPEVFVHATIVLEFSGADTMEVAVETLNIQQGERIAARALAGAAAAKTD